MLQEKQKCNMKKMQKELTHSEDVQFLAAAQLVREKTIGWAEDATKTLKLIAMKIYEHAESPEEFPSERKSSSDNELDSSLENDQNLSNATDADDLNLTFESNKSSSANTIESELDQYKKFTKNEWKSCKYNLTFGKKLTA